MARAIIGTNVKVEVQATKGSAITVTGVSKAAEGVVTASNTLTDGDVVVFVVAGGMVELDGQACRVKTASGSGFTLEGLDTTNYSTWTAGTCYEVATWATMDAAQSVSMPNPAPQKIDVTTLIDTSKQYVYGLPDAPDGSIKGLYNPNGTAEQYIKAATKSNSNLAFRLNFASGEKVIFNAAVSGGSGFELPTNAAAETTISFTPRKDVMSYVS